MNQQPTREKAYVDAILAAGIIYSITKDCSEGVIEECGCNSNLKREIEENAIITSYLFPSKLQMERDWAWGGCSDDSSFGENLVLKLLDKNEKSGDPQSFVSRHNNRIGREVSQNFSLERGDEKILISDHSGENDEELSVPWGLWKLLFPDVLDENAHFSTNRETAKRALRQSDVYQLRKDRRRCGSGEFGQADAFRNRHQNSIQG